MTMVRLIIVLFGLCLVVQAWNMELNEGDDSILEIPQGALIGEWRKSLEGRLYSAYESIPYAKSPVGKRRFAAPQRAKKWYGALKAKSLPNECIQWNHDLEHEEKSVVGQEDCLYLNVYSPNPTAGANLPVIVYIHGGAFLFGTSRFYGPRYLMDKDVIYVSINYRLGPFGFMTTEDCSMPGNLGMKDQVMALRWVRDNIYHFGGNPKSVTIAGMSAGGASVHYHMLSPMSKGLFHKAISMSGTAFCSWTLQENAREKAMALGDFLGCPTSTSKEMVDCLRHKPAYHIVKAINIFMPWYHAPFSPVAPVVESQTNDEAFLSQHPYKAVLKGHYNDVPWITSVTEHEGLYPAAIYLMKPEYLKVIEDRWTELSPFFFDFNYTLPLEKHAFTAFKIKQQYFNNEPITLKNYENFVQAISDRSFIMDVVKTTKLQAVTSKQPIYFYFFRYQGADSLSKYLSHSNKVYGVSHGDDTAYAIDASYMNTTTTRSDRKMIKFMTNMWASFATNGVPKVSKWEPVSPDQSSIKYLEIMSPENYEMKIGTDMGHTSFWSSLGLQENEHFKNPREKNEL